MGLVGSRNVATMLLQDARANRETQSGGVSVSIEAGLEDMVDLVRTDAATGVGEFDCDVSFTSCGTVLAPQPNNDAAARRDMANGIRNQVESHGAFCLPDAVVVCGRSVH